MAAAMKSVLSVLTFKIICFLSFCTPQDLPTLRLVNILYRHGDRSPAKSFPTNPLPDSAWPQGYGQLTEEGMREQYHLGQFYRDYYRNFLNGSYDRYQISVLSSNLDRCLESAECHLAGLYPTSAGRPGFLPNIRWQPIPIHTVPEKNDSILAMQAPCPAYDEAYNKVLHSDAVKQEEKRNKAFYVYVGEKTGLGHENISDIWEVADTLHCEIQHNYTLPKWANSTIINKLKTLESYSFMLMYNTTVLQRLKGGPLLKLMLKNMDDKVKGINGTLDAERARMYMYSGHDSTVAALLSALGVYNDISPPYASSVLLELHEDPPNMYYVQVFYKNGSQPILLTLPGCSDKCPFEKFVDLTSPVIPDNWEEECGVSDHQSSETLFKFSLLMLGVLIGCFVICTVIIVLIAIKCVRKSPKTQYSLLVHDEEK